MKKKLLCLLLVLAMVLPMVPVLAISVSAEEPVETSIQLAPDYYRAEYIVPSGAYIDTGVKISSDDTLTSMIFTYEDTSIANCQLYDCGGDNSLNRVSAYVGIGGNWRWGGKTILLPQLLSQCSLSIIQNSTGLFINGNYIENYYSPKAFTETAHSLVLFDTVDSTSATNDSFCGKFVSLKIENGNDLLHNFVACYKKSTSTYGIYDTVDNRFFESERGILNGTLAKGINDSSISEYTALVPNEYVVLDYVTAAGSSYIDTGVKISSDYTIMSKVGYLPNSYNAKMLYATDDTSNIDRVSGYYSLNGNWRWGGRTITLPIDASEDIIVQDATGLCMNGKCIGCYDSPKTFAETSNSLALFDLYGTETTSDAFNGRLFYLIIKNGTTVIHAYIPAFKIASKEIGLYDVIEEEFLVSSRTPLETDFDKIKDYVSYEDYQVDFVSSFGNAYVDTGLTAQKGDRIEIEFASLDDAQMALFGAGSGGASTDRIQVFFDNPTIGYIMRTGATYSELITKNIAIKRTAIFDLVNGKGYFDGEEVISFDMESTELPDETLYLFARNINGSPNFCATMSLYSYKHYRNGVLIADIIPVCIEGKYALYDKITGSVLGEEQPLYGESTVITASRYVAVNADTGEVYTSQNMTVAGTTASTAKMMTCILAIENLDLNDRTVPLLSTEVTTISSAGLYSGESLLVKDALYALMLPSGNDAAYMLARTVSGSVSDFVNLMNQKAAEIGMNYSTFSDPQCGYTLASYDLAVLIQYAMQNETFRKVVSTQQYDVEEDGLGAHAHHWMNTNANLSQYEGVIGGKTGTINSNDTHLVNYATKDGINIIGVINNSNSANRYTDMKKVLDAGFTKAAAQPYTVTAEDNVLTVTNPVSGYTMTCTITASDVDDPSSSLETATVTTVCSTGSWNPYLEIDYDFDYSEGTATASISYGGETASVTYDIPEGSVFVNNIEYATLAEAIAAAKSGDTITLYDNVTDNYVVIETGITLDLNGYNITSKLFYATGAVIDNGTTKGIVKADNYVLTPGVGSDFAVKNGEGYSFYHPGSKSGAISAVGSETNTFKFGFGTSENRLADRALLFDKLIDGSEVSGVKVSVTVNWYNETTKMNVSQTFVFDDDLVKTYCDKVNAKLLAVTISGLDTLSDYVSVYGSFVSYDAKGNELSRINTDTVTLIGTAE